MAWDRLAIGAGSRLLNGQLLSAEIPNSIVGELGSVDWILICRRPVMFCGWIANWIEWVSLNTPAIAAFMDEDEADCSDRQLPLFHDPRFGSAFDPFMPRNSYLAHSAIAVRRDAMHLLAGNITQDFDQWWIELVEKLSGEGPLAHIPRVLVSRLPNISKRAIAPTLASENSSAGQRARIAVIVPTRDMQPFLERCVSSLLETASDKSRLDILVVDNGSSDPLTLAYLEKAERLGLLRRLAVDEPFNWSRLNNIAVDTITSDFVVFANNDLEMKSYGWDDVVIRSLQDCRIGAIGAKLLYPDNTIQHAGIVFGIAGATEHEGRGQFSAVTNQDRTGTRHSVSAVTGAFLACRRSDCSGFDEKLPIAFNDVDFCLSLRSRGMHIVYEPDILAVHFESKSLAWAVPGAARSGGFEAAKQYMRQKWGAALLFDPGVNPHFATWGRPLEYIREPPMSDILSYIRWSAQSSPWKVSLPAVGNEL